MRFFNTENGLIFIKNVFSLSLLQKDYKKVLTFSDRFDILCNRKVIIGVFFKEGGDS